MKALLFAAIVLMLVGAALLIVERAGRRSGRKYPSGGTGGDPSSRRPEQGGPKAAEPLVPFVLDEEASRSRGGVLGRGSSACRNGQCTGVRPDRRA